MSAIAGIVEPNWDVVKMALKRMAHRGGHGGVVAECAGVTLGEVHPAGLKMWLGRAGGCRAACAGVIYNWQSLAEDALDVDHALDALYDQYGAAFVGRLDGAFAIAIAREDGLFLARDPLGIAPLYWGERNGSLCFASEMKALLAMTQSVHEFPPGHYYRPVEGFVRFYELPGAQHRSPDAGEAAENLREGLAHAVAKCLAVSKSVGCCLSGGLDSSTVAALARLHLQELHTFAVGVEGSADLEYARTAARHLGCRHHELHVTNGALLHAIPQVIYHLESYDPLLVRSSLANYRLAELASEHVTSVLCGEGADELFAGYDYLADLEPNLLSGELRAITASLYGGGLKRVDRCFAAHGLSAHVPFLDGRIVSYAFSLPVHYKMHRNARPVGKWILRKAAAPLLPAAIVDRPKAKFWEGAGVLDLVQHEAERVITDEEFEAERRLHDGSVLASKEELLYYRVFRDQFGELC